MSLSESVMRFLTYDELTRSMKVDHTLIQLSAFGGTFPARAIALWRRRTKLFSDYVAVFAVESGRVLGQVFVLRIPYAFPDGVETISGIAAVATRPDRGRSGVARAIFREVEQRESEAGIRHAALWTNRSWGAHALYEELGYRDIYSSPWAVHDGRTGGRGPPRPRGVRPARASDLSAIENLHARYVRGRWGFCRNSKGYLATALAARMLEPSKEFVVTYAGDRLTGYAEYERSPSRLLCTELVAPGEPASRRLAREVGRMARHTAYAFLFSFVTDRPEMFRNSGYSRVPGGWFVLMGRQVGRTRGVRAMAHHFGTDDRRFVCFGGDRF